jgi:hypothetical protein
MDISSIVNMGSSSSTSSSLNDDFCATTPAGDNVFSKIMGSRTVFETPGKGAVVASFIFDPKQKFSDNHIMASVVTDYMAELRDGLTRHLLNPKDIVPKPKTLEETIWEQLTSALPKDTLTKNLFSDRPTFEAYRELLTTNVTKNFNEEDLLTRAMREKAFHFAFEIAIDAYPGEMGTKETKPNGPKCGVLTFYLEGIPDGNVPQAKEEKDEEEEPTKSKKRKADADGGKKSEKEQILVDLALTEFASRATVESSKKFPPTATLFFESLGRWFSSVVTRKSAKLEKDKNRSHLYH